MLKSSQKKTILIPFFFILISLFLNITSFALQADRPEGPSDTNKFIPPLVLCDYNKGSALTNLGGLWGGDEERPGITYAMVARDDGITLGNAGYSVSLDYNVEKWGEYSFYWIKLGREIRPAVSEVLDLRRYNYLSFWVKSAQGTGDIKIEMHEDINGDGIFTFGKDISSYVYLKGYLKKGLIDTNWSKVIIPLKDFNEIKDWSKMIELVYVFENKTGNIKGTVYLDEILFGYRPIDVLLSKNPKAIMAPIENSFKINGMIPKKCPAVKRSNDLEINAEDLSENPFIESVRFDYSIDKGNIWRAIGSDYNVDKDIYKVRWEPDNSRELYNYRVRAVATDLSGNEKATGVLLDCGIKPITDEEFLNLIEMKAFEFFNDHQDQKTGLFTDTSGGGDASIASTGLGIAALCVGAEEGWIDRNEARRRVILALGAFLPQGPGKESLAEGRYGFFYHFLNIHTAKRAGRSEISTIDTAILLAGAITAGEYFGGDVKEKAQVLYKGVEWEKFLCKEKGPWYDLFSMGWSPERGFLESYWDYSTDEVMLINLLAIGSPTHPVSPDVFYAWTRQSGSYKNGKPYIYSWHGALFSYQYANIWFNFQNLVDKKGVNWFENSTNATLANRQFCIDNSDRFKGYGPNSWGVTSMARPEAYTMHFGTPPMGSGDPQYDGTISPTGPAGSIIFTPYLSISALKYMYGAYPKLWGQYGFRDSFNLDLNWYANTYYGIGVAMILLPIENFRYGFIWKNFMKNDYIKEALLKAGFTEAKPRRTAFSNGTKPRR